MCMCVCVPIVIFAEQQARWEDAVEKELPAEWTELKSVHCPSDQAKTHFNTEYTHGHKRNTSQYLGF